MESKKISVIIPSGRPERVGETLQALQQQTISKSEFAIFIVTADAISIASEFSMNIGVVMTERLFAPGCMRNRGAESAAGELFAFIDDDCVPPENWLSVMVEKLLLDQRTGAVGCRVVSGDKTYWGRCADYCLFGDYQGRNERKSALGSAAILVRRQAFEEVGGFDNELLASEDWDFSLRLQEKNWDCIFIPEIEVQHHHGRSSFVEIIKNSYRSGIRSGLIVQERNRLGLSWLARLSLACRSPLIYWLLILPYASAITLLQLILVVKLDSKVMYYSPIMLASRIVYHCGVWRRLLADKLTRYT